MLHCGKGAQVWKTQHGVYDLEIITPASNGEIPLYDG